MITKLLTLLLTLFLIPTASANPAVNLDIQSIDITASSTKGGNQRGAALAVLQDGSLLLGGGNYRLWPTSSHILSQVST